VAEDIRGFARDFLYKIIDDSQGTIRALDTKAGLGIVVLGAMISKMLDQDQVKLIAAGGKLTVVLGVLFAVSWIGAAILAFKTVFPMINPAENVELPASLRPPFFLAKLSHSGFLRHFSGNKNFARLAETHASYSSALQAASVDVIEAVAVAEVLKLSFIRQMKTDRLGLFAKTLVVAVIAFLALTFLTPKQAPPSTTIRCIQESAPLATKPSASATPLPAPVRPKKTVRK
jgi:hypothetical protein